MSIGKPNPADHVHTMAISLDVYEYHEAPDGCDAYDTVARIARQARARN